MGQDADQAASPVRRSVVYTGRVQGVGFRATVASLARGCPVSGWVRNESNGDVRAEIQGGRGDVEAFVERTLRETPGRINQHVVSDEPTQLGEDGFAIRG
ncbi:MAG: acylphosphatase [Planctomycetota bacterium]